ncbi:MAG: 3-hydroxybutyrate dehydrogenase [Rhodobacteraceae bacterium]|nr:3-hydroxybutyrate dehydrogenase [Paracoccaceae bacterium]
MIKTALVTGSTSGIGLALARAMAGQGMNVVLNGFGDADQIGEIRAGIASDTGMNVTYSPADMTRPDEIEAMIAAAVSEHGSLDVLVNNAGIQHVAPIDEFPVAQWDAIIAVNLSHAFHTTRLALPHMKANGWGRVLNMASAHGLVASPYKSAYVAAKHGLIGMTKAVALEVAQQGITVNAICPGYVKTALVESQIPETARARGMTEEDVVRDVILAAQPTRRFVGPDELGQMAVFLTSDAAASITGAAISVDGGWTAY